MQSGFFLTIEGGEGAGKTSLQQKLQRHYAQKGVAVVTSREPGGIDIAEQIRAVILNNHNTAMDGRTEALLYAAARRQHLQEKVEPALAAGKLVICDRFIDSSVAYQGYARGIGIEEILQINAFATAGRFPDMTLYLDLDPEVGMQRIHASGDREVNRLDQESIAFHRKVREGYRVVASRFASRVHTVDAAQPEALLWEDVLRLLDPRIDEWRRRCDSQP